ncbi:unnamed protein product [Umbelopsis ramanniana]
MPMFDLATQPIHSTILGDKRLDCIVRYDSSTCQSMSCRLVHCSISLNSTFSFFFAPPFFLSMVFNLAVDLLNPSVEQEKRSHKLKRLVQSPNSYFMDVKCPGCFNITTVFSHAQTVVLCSSCATVLCQPTGGRARLTEGCSFRRKLN